MTEAEKNIKNFAEQVDALAEEVLERVQIEKVLEKIPGPIMKMISGDVFTMQIRNMCYQLAMKYPEKVWDFMRWISDETAIIVTRFKDTRFDEK